MNNIKQLMNSLILCHLLCSYLILSIQLEFSHSKSIIDIIFSDYISQEIISGNLTSTISDPLHQFLIAPHSFWNAPNKISSIFERNWFTFNREEFILDCFTTDWPNILKLQNNNTNRSFQNFFDSINKILDKNAQL